MDIGTRIHSTSHSSGIITTTVSSVNGSTGNTRELYVHLDVGYGNGILNDNYPVWDNSLNKLKILRSQSPTIVLQMAHIQLGELSH